MKVRPGVRAGAIAVAGLVALATTVVATPASAQIAENIQIPMTGVVLQDAADLLPAEEACLGEDLLGITGQLHIVVTYTENANRISGTVVVHPMNAHLVGIESGQEWIGTGAAPTEHFSEPVSDHGATSVKTTQSFKIISKGNAPDLRTQVVVHATYRADGELTADIDRISVTCR